MFKLLQKSRKNEYTDQELIEEYKRTGNTAFVGELFVRYTPLLATIAHSYFGRSALGEDAIMEIFEILVKDLKKHEVKNFKSWLFSVARNHYLKIKRKEGVMDLFDKDVGKTTDLFVENGDELSLKLESEELLTRMEGSLSQLKEEQRVCVELFYLKSKSYKEVAEETGYDLKKVKSHIQNGKRNLKIILEGGNG